MHAPTRDPDAAVARARALLDDVRGRALQPSERVERAAHLAALLHGEAERRERPAERARRTLLAADFVSLLGAVVLYVLSIGSVRGFAFALGLTTIVDVLVAFTFTRPVVALLAGTKFFQSGHPLSGVDPKRLGIPDSPAPRAAATAGRK